MVVPIRDAGSVSDFLSKIQRSQWSDDGIDTPCGDCDLCCRGLSISIEADESSTLDAIEPQLLDAHQSGDLSYWTIKMKPDGSCPKLVGGKCSIWKDRPRVCKRFDCRLFALGELPPPVRNQSFTDRVNSWRFSIDLQDDEENFEAFRRAMQLISLHQSTFAKRGIEAGTIQAASLAIDLRHLFFKQSDSLEQKDQLAEALVEMRRMQSQVRSSAQRAD